jgi:hypothetical protein
MEGNMNTKKVRTTQEERVHQDTLRSLKMALEAARAANPNITKEEFMAVGMDAYKKSIAPMAIRADIIATYAIGAIGVCRLDRDTSTKREDTWTF